MKTPSKPDQRALTEVTAAQEFYAGIGQEAGYFPALWHTLNVGHMLAIDLDRLIGTLQTELNHHFIHVHRSVSIGCSVANFCAVAKTTGLDWQKYLTINTD